MKKKYFPLRAIAFLMVLFVTLQSVSQVLSQKEFRSSIAPIYDLPKNSLDVLFFGSSHMNCSVSPMLLWEKYGITSFNCGIGDQTLPGTYYLMREILKIQTPKVIVLETYRINFNAKLGALKEERLHWFTDNVPFSYGVHEAIQDLTKAETDKTEYYLPIYSYHSRWKELTKEDFTDPKRPFFRGMDRLTTYRGFEDAFEGYEDILEPPEIPMKYLEKIIELCAKKNIPLVLMTAPYQSESVPTVRYMQNYLGKVAEQRNIPYIDFFNLYRKINLDSMRDMADSGHLNIFGAEKVTTYLGEYLKENYGLQDHRREDNYKFWWDDLITYQHDRNTVALEIVSAGLEIYGFSQYYSLLNEKGYIVAISALAESDDDIGKLNELVRQFGSTENYDKVPLYYSAIFEDGKKLWEYADTTVSNQSSMVSDLEVAIGNQKYGGGELAIAVDGEIILDQKDGINVVVFDKFTHEIVSKVRVQ